MDKPSNIFDFQVYDVQACGDRSKLSKTIHASKNQTTQPKRLMGSLSHNSTKLLHPQTLAALANSTTADTPLVSGWYCQPCKKKFGSESTLIVHQQSEKHKKAARAAANSASPRAATLSKSTPALKQQQPEIRNAMGSLKKARGIIKEQPAMAATVLWNIAREVAQFGDDLLTLSALEGAIECFEMMNKDANLRGTKGTPAFWTPRSLLKTMLECQLAVARMCAGSDQARASEQYMKALCQFLGIEQTDIDSMTTRTKDPVELQIHAKKLAESVPRKFAKDEDLDQAISAMREAAGALCVFSGAKKTDTMAWRGLAVYFLAYEYTLLREKQQIAYNLLCQIVDVLEHLGLPHLGRGCAILVAERHAEQPDARVRVAKAVMESIEANDLVRAQALLNVAGNVLDGAWLNYLKKYVERKVEADAPWMRSEAMAEWKNVSGCGAKDKSVLDIAKVIDAALRRELQQYDLYTPILKV